jgi:predicted alpha/beta-hydrolase family hydrolase
MTIEVLKPESGKFQTAVILAHGAGQGMHSPFMTYFHNELPKRGYMSVRFNFDYMDAKRSVPDPQPKLQARYRSVIDQVKKEHRPSRLMIGGKSMGGRVASYIAGDAGVDGLLFLGYPLHAPGKTHQLRDEHLYALKLPMLFISGTKDTFAERPLLDRVVEKISSARLVWVEGGDHSLKRGRKDSDSLSFALDSMDEWIRSITSAL